MNSGADPGTLPPGGRNSGLCTDLGQELPAPGCESYTLGLGSWRRSGAAPKWLNSWRRCRFCPRSLNSGRGCGSCHWVAELRHGVRILPIFRRIPVERGPDPDVSLLGSQDLPAVSGAVQGSAFRRLSGTLRADPAVFYTLPQRFQQLLTDLSTEIVNRSHFLRPEQCTPATSFRTGTGTREQALPRGPLPVIPLPCCLCYHPRTVSCFRGS